MLTKAWIAASGCALLAMTIDTRWIFLCHCEERSDAVIHAFLSSVFVNNFKGRAVRLAFSVVFCLALIVAAAHSSGMPCQRGKRLLSSPMLSMIRPTIMVTRSLMPDGR